MKYKCPCCGFYTYDTPPNGTYDICSVCFWEDDPIQLEQEDYSGGANKVSLKQARENYRRFGACEARLLPYVREPLDEELEGNDSV